MKPIGKKTKYGFEAIRKDIIFCMSYLKMPQLLSVFVGNTYETYYLQFALKKKLVWESYFQYDLESTLHSVLARVNYRPDAETDQLRVGAHREHCISEHGQSL
jgi:hypothetical protein